MITPDWPLALSYDDVLLAPQYSDIDSRSEVDLSTEISSGLKLRVPLISTKMDTVTGVEMAVAMGKLGGMGILPRFEKRKRQVDQVREVVKEKVVVGAAVGVNGEVIKRAEELVKAGAMVINVDVAHGHMRQTIETTRKLKERFGDKITLISGIAATGEAAEDLYKAGADSLLVGVGAGSICTTRVMTGSGVPGFQSLIDVAPVARRYKKTFMPDAGIRNSGDIVKALAAGASAIVAGSLFAGTDETPGEVFEHEGRMYKSYNGSASEKEKKSQLERNGKNKSKMYAVHVEGVEATVPYKGAVADLVMRLTAGVRSGLSYSGARSIPEMWEKAKFIRVTHGGHRESGAHDVIVA